MKPIPALGDVVSTYLVIFPAATLSTFCQSAIGIRLYYVTQSDKRGTKSLGRFRDNWRKHRPGVLLINLIFLILFIL